MSTEAKFRIRNGRVADREFIRKLSEEAFARFGEYETTLPDLVERPWVRTLVAEAESVPIAFAMFTLERAPSFEADLVAIAVAADWRSHGVGAELLEKVEDTVRELARGRESPAVRLTVAHDNDRARQLFEAAGYEYVPEEQGKYPGGQTSIGMRKELEEEE